jgi:hypothetical protein
MFSILPPRYLCYIDIAVGDSNSYHCTNIAGLKGIDYGYLLDHDEQYSLKRSAGTPFHFALVSQSSTQDRLEGDQPSAGTEIRIGPPESA